MRVRLSDPNLREDLAAALNEGGCISSAIDDGCEILAPFAVPDQEARVEVAFFVRAWQMRYPHVTVELTA
jgi:hypothetical protein